MKRWLAIAGVAGLLVTCVLLWHNLNLSAHWAIRQLRQADEASRESRAQAVARQDLAVVRMILAELSQDDSAHVNLGAGLEAFAQARLNEYLSECEASYPTLAETVKPIVLHTFAGPLTTENALPDPLVERLLTLIQASPESSRPAGLALASVMAPRSSPRWAIVWRDWAEKGIAHPNPEIRESALRLAMQEPLQRDRALLTAIVPLLRDADPRLRKSALLALGTDRSLVADDDLLGMLHDDDLTVRHQCEVILRGRGLSEQQLHLARLITDPRPTTRGEVVGHLFDGEVDAGTWLRRLSQDTAPSVRVTALKAAVQHSDGDVRQLVRDLAERDPSPTVRELAHYLLHRRER